MKLVRLMENQRPADGPSRSHRWFTTGAIAAALVVGLAVRLYNVTGSLWLDEFSTLWSVERDLSEVSRRVISFQGQTPLYYWATWASVHWLGESEFALRLPSLMASALIAVGCGAAAWRVAGRRSGILALCGAWLSFSLVQAAVNARPYTVAMFGVTIAMLGAVGQSRQGLLRDGILIALGGALAFWSHFVLAIPVLVMLAWQVAAGNRRERARALLAGAVLVTVCLPAYPWFLAGIGRPQHVHWLTTAQHGDAIVLLLPFTFALLPIGGDVRVTSAGRRVERMLAVVIVGTVVVLELASLAGAGLVSARYCWPIVIPATVLASVRLTRYAREGVGVAITCFLATTLASYGLTLRSTGSFSGLGVEDWRGATEAIADALSASEYPVVLLRSGFVEEDIGPPGTASDATRAVIRSPGQTARPWRVVPLTYSWSNPHRAAYFEQTIAPAIRGQSTVVVLCQHAVEATSGSYATNVTEWIERTVGPVVSVRHLDTARGIDVSIVHRRLGL